VLFGDRVIQLSSDLAQLPTSASKLPEMKLILFFNSTNMNSNQQQITKVTLPLSKLLDFMNSSFKCHSCNSFEGKKITLERYGIASTIYFDCMNCGAATSRQSDLSNNLESKWSAKPPATNFKD
jgi:hypothetical protein